MKLRSAKNVIAVLFLATFILAVRKFTPPQCIHLIKPRLILYTQTTHDSGHRPISVLPLVEERGTTVTHLIIAAFHVNEGAEIHLNDYPPTNPIFETLWDEVELLKAAGVKVLGMVGGAASGSFSQATLDGNDTTFEKYYQQLHEMIKDRQLQGIDLDIEEKMSQDGVNRLIRRLRTDFGSDFIITLAPVASALLDGANLSGFSYSSLEADVGSDIAFYNVQFYNGFGSMATAEDYRRLVEEGWDPLKVVAGQLTSPKNGNGYIPFLRLGHTISALRAEFARFGGISGWEYYNGGDLVEERPWEWPQLVSALLWS